MMSYGAASKLAPQGVYSRTVAYYPDLYFLLMFIDYCGASGKQVLMVISNQTNYCSSFPI